MLYLNNKYISNSYFYLKCCQMNEIYFLSENLLNYIVTMNINSYILNDFYLHMQNVIKLQSIQ